MASIVIESYENGTVNYYCNKCNLFEVRDISDVITEDCALDIDIVCKECGSLRILYMLKCTNAALAKDLNARLEVLRLNREAGVSNHGYKTS